MINLFRVLCVSNGTSIAENEKIKAIFTYEYRYDDRGHMVKKILPQKDIWDNLYS